MVLLDGQVSAKPPADTSARPLAGTEVATLGRLAEEISRFASWTTRATSGSHAEPAAEAATAVACTHEPDPPSLPAQPETQRPGVLGRFRRH